MSDSTTTDRAMEPSVSGPQNAAAEAIRRAANNLLDAAATAAQLRWEHAQVLAHPMQYQSQAWSVATARREADSKSGVALEKYIDCLLENSPRQQ